jgi:hypothetical protein
MYSGSNSDGATRITYSGYVSYVAVSLAMHA